MGFFKDFGGSLINGVSGLVGGLFGLKNTSDVNRSNLAAVRETNAANRELARYNWEQQKEMWRTQNAYNSPLAQMHRLRQAGLNPNLVYGNGVTGNTSSSLPTPSLPSQEAPKFQRADYGFIGRSSEAAVQSYLQNKSLDSQIKLQDSQASAIASENIVRSAKVASIMARTARDRFDLDLARDLRENTVAAARLSLKSSSEDLVRRQNENSLFPLQRQKLMSEISLMGANRNLSVKQAEKITSEIWKISEEVANFAVQRGLWRSQASLNNANAEFVDTNTAFNDVTFNTRTASLVQGLSNAVRDGKIKDYETFERYLRTSWQQAYGFTNDQMSGFAKTLHYQLTSLYNSITQ